MIKNRSEHEQVFLNMGKKVREIQRLLGLSRRIVFIYAAKLRREGKLEVPPAKKGRP